MSASKSPEPTIGFVDEYCQLFAELFPQVRSYEAFKHLHLGMISDIKRKSLPAIARAVGLENHQSLHHFLREAPWVASDLSPARKAPPCMMIINGRPQDGGKSLTG